MIWNVSFTINRERISSTFVRSMIIGSVAPGLIQTMLGITARWILFQPTEAIESRDCRSRSENCLEGDGNVGVKRDWKCGFGFYWMVFIKCIKRCIIRNLITYREDHPNGWFSYLLGMAPPFSTEYPFRAVLLSHQDHIDDTSRTNEVVCRFTKLGNQYPTAA